MFAQSAVAQPKRAANVRKAKKPEEQILSLKKWILGLSIALLTVILTFTVTTAILARQLNEARNATPPGQNYSTMDSIK